MKNRLLSTIFLFALWFAVFAFVPATSAQILFSSGTYSTNFDALANTGTANAWADNSTLLGWYASKSLGGAAIAAYRAGAGTDNNGALYSFGSAASTERALGSVGSGTPGTLAYGVRFINDTTLAITNITVTYTGEQWRNGGNTATQTLAFSYRISGLPITTSDAANANAWTAASSLDFNTPTVGATAGPLDGNAITNRQVFSAVLLPGALVFPGQEAFFRWVDINDSGNDHGLAIDDLTIAFTTTPAITNPPAISPGGQPQSRTNNANTTATFTVAATGTALEYQWRKDDVNLSDGVKVSGSTSPTLTLSGLLDSDAGGYSVVVANGGGSVTSAVAVLTVIDPAVNTQPQSRTNVAGDTANFFVVAAGTIPLSYQWRFNGADIAGANASSLNVPNVQPSNQGAYAVVVGNILGNATTSAVANLTVLATPTTRLVRWDFNDTNTLSVTAPAPASGTGAASLVGGVTASFGVGTFSDPAGPPGAANSDWTTTTYAAQGTSNKLRGVQFNTSTIGYQNILLTWEERHSNTGSKYVRLQYSTDGLNFVDGDVVTMEIPSSFGFFSSDLSALPGVNNNPNFAFRIVEEWEATAIGNNNSNFVATATGSTYGTGGTMRFDLVTAFGNTFSGVSPIPLNIQLVGNDVVLAWSDPAFALQSAPAVTGTYTNVPGATSPHTNAASGSAEFFRLKN